MPRDQSADEAVSFIPSGNSAATKASFDLLKIAHLFPSLVIMIDIVVSHLPRYCTLVSSAGGSGRWARWHGGGRRGLCA